MVKSFVKKFNFLIVLLLLILAAISFVAVNYKYKNFGDSKIDEILFYMANGLANGQSDSLVEAIWSNAPYALVIFMILWLPTVDKVRQKIYILIKKIFPKFAQNNSGKAFTFKKKIIYSSVLFVAGFALLLQSFSIPAYVVALTQSTKLYEENYINPKTAEITFPSKKRNLIYIYLESMENTLMSQQNGGVSKKSVIPELENLALNNLSFSNKKSGIGGALPAHGTTWTVGGMTAQSAGVTLKRTLAGGRDHNSMGDFKLFLPGAYTIGDILKKEGYNQSFVMGSDAAFGGRDKLLTQHGDYKLLDLNYAYKHNKIPKDYKVWWGYEDKRMFQFAKEEATRLSQQDKPFNLQMLTVDTHYVDGWFDNDCAQEYPHKYDNVHACSSKQVNDFVQWAKKQPFYENTTIIISGDHLGMQTDYYNQKINGRDYQRTIYNAFINSPIKPKQSKERLFATFDMYPSTLAAIGAKIKGERLGLGTNLFSGEKTLVERFGGLDKLNMELPKRSSFYEQRILTTRKSR